ncbi:L-fucose:H+ symporter permease [Cellulomonas fengjieae]|uniref:L-fucose:H+ symporter permease n=1 Tax=Cellulomonas fengjieae TaxID=2819978 RepID=A0ABS3SIC9_9CELL|nr:L-fucose:H+ symporter permease [Cellulomonas fengjieae]MBO3084726.1 L-fucose:H+ symporter permease [Cellulomonas fengjieae]MBO3103508.1 L-fucose:H+ symporter permease [Cellulomonas fengjieae]QVI66952.1 L-fucose:H+ symporter permease [Cellulomonas fengjieae]
MERPTVIKPGPELGSPRKKSLVYPGLSIPFILLVLCFAAWGSAANLTDVLVGVFRHIFLMSNFQSALVQFAYYGAYFALAIPAALINKRFGYKAGVLTGLGLATVGGFLFIPAGMLLEYGFFLIALFVLAAGLSILETSANPFVISMGPEATATQRLNLAQAFNPVGANIGVLLGAVLILPNITPEEQKAEMSAQQLEQAQETDLSLVLGPYTGIATALLVIWLLIAFRKITVPDDDHVHFGLEETSGGAFARLWRNRHYRYGVVAQFLNVAAQVCVWSFTIQYAQDVVGVPASQAGWYLQASLILFLLSRFVMTYLLGIMRPTKLLFAMGVLGVVLALIAALVPNMVGLIAVVAISVSLSLMFPTIYGVALQGLGADTKFGAAGLVMAILGGALAPPVMGLIMDSSGTAAGFIIPAVCLAAVAGYALFDLRSGRHVGPLPTEATAH